MKQLNLFVKRFFFFFHLQLTRVRAKYKNKMEHNQQIYFMLNHCCYQDSNAN